MHWANAATKGAHLHLRERTAFVFERQHLEPGENPAGAPRHAWHNAHPCCNLEPGPAAQFIPIDRA